MATACAGTRYNRNTSANVSASGQRTLTRVWHSGTKNSERAKTQSNYKNSDYKTQITKTQKRLALPKNKLRLMIGKRGRIIFRDRARLHALRACGRTPAVPVGSRLRPDLPLYGPLGRGRHSAARPAEGVTHVRSREETRFSTPTEFRRFHCPPSGVRSANRPGPARCSSRRRRCGVLRDCEFGSCRAGS